MNVGATISSRRPEHEEVVVPAEELCDVGTGTLERIEQRERRRGSRSAGSRDQGTTPRTPARGRFAQIADLAPFVWSDKRVLLCKKSARVEADKIASRGVMRDLVRVQTLPGLKVVGSRI